MPYPTQITRELVVDKARELIEADGIDQLSLGRLAAALSVKAPSLYRYFDGKTGLLHAVNEVTNRALIAQITQAAAEISDADTENADRARVLAMARAYRAFAHAYPVTYSLLFANSSPELRPDAAESEQGAIALQAVMASLTGEANSLAALRGLMALAHGYATLELNEQYRRGGDLDETFNQIVEAYINGWHL